MIKRIIPPLSFLLISLGIWGCVKTESPEATEFVVDGLKVVFKPTPGNPVLTAGFYLRGGTNYVNPKQAGIETFLFDVATRGTKTLSKDALNSRLESMGTTLALQTQYDFTGLTMRCIQRFKDDSWDLFVDVLLNPAFKNEELELVRQKMQSAIDAEEDNPDSYLNRITNDLFYEGHPYGISLNGTSSSISRISRQDLIDYHKNGITKKRALLIVVGDTDVQKAMNMARALASGLPMGNDINLPSLDFDAGSADIAVAERDLPTNYIRGMAAGPPPGDPDFPAFTAAMRILRNKLFEEVRTKRNLSYAPSAGYSFRKSNYGYIYVTAVDPETTIKVMFETIDRMAAEPLPEKDVKNEITTAITRELMSQESAVAQQLQLAQWEIVGGDWRLAGQYLPEMKALGAADIQRMIKQYMKNLHFGIVGHPEQIDVPLFKRQMSES